MTDRLDVAIQVQKYLPVEFCIYCGTEVGPFGLEHIIPFGLVGRLELPLASCKKCEKITCKIETHCLQRMMGPFRYRIGIKSRKKKARPTEIPVIAHMPDGLAQNVSIPLDDIPRFLNIPKFPLPSVISGMPPTDTGMMWVRGDARDLEQFAAKYGTDKLTLSTFELPMFIRMLAKIAHSYAFAAVPFEQLSRFELLLPDLILNGTGELLDVVGGDEQPHDHKSDELHEIRLMYLTRELDELLLCRIRLFGAMRAPAHLVVVGKRNLSSQERECLERQPQPTVHIGRSFDPPENNSC